MDSSPKQSFAGFESQVGFSSGLSSAMGSSPKQGFARVPVPGTWVQIPRKVLDGFNSWPCGFKSQRMVEAHRSPKQGFGNVQLQATWDQDTGRILAWSSPSHVV